MTRKQKIIEMIETNTKTLSENITIRRTKGGESGYYILITSDVSDSYDRTKEAAKIGAKLNLTSKTRNKWDHSFAPPKYWTNKSKSIFGWGYFVPSGTEQEYIDDMIANLKTLVDEYNVKEKLDVDLKTSQLTPKQIKAVEDIVDAVESAEKQNKDNKVKRNLEKYLDDLEEAIENDEVYEFLIDTYEKTKNFQKKNMSFYKYSFLNSLIIRYSDPQATFAAPKSVWKSKGYDVKDEYKSGIVIIKLGGNRDTTWDNAKWFIQHEKEWKEYKDYANVNQNLSVEDYLRQGGYKAAYQLASYGLKNSLYNNFGGGFTHAKTYTDTMIQPIPGKEQVPLFSDELYAKEKDVTKDELKEKIKNLYNALISIANKERISVLGVPSESDNINNLNELLWKVAKDRVETKYAWLLKKDNTQENRDLIKSYAEAISHIVRKHYGLPSESSKYNIANFGADRESLKRESNKLLNIANYLIDGIDKEIEKLNINEIYDTNPETEVPITLPDTETMPDEDEEFGLTPDEWEEDMPGPKPKAYSSISLNEIFSKLKIYEDSIRNKQLISEKRRINQEMAMNIDEPEFDEPHETVKAGIEGKKKTAFSDVDFFTSKKNDMTTLEKLGSDEFNNIIKTLKPLGKMSMMEIQQTFMLMHSIEMQHKDDLEKLALKKVKEQFGLPDEVSNKLEAKLVKNVNKPDNDNDNLVKTVEKDMKFTDKEKEIIRKNIDKRKIQNALMMGAGFRAHTTFNQIKNDLNSIDEKLYPLYEKVMPNVSLFLWKIPFEDMMGGVQMMGLSKLKKDKNNKVKAEAQAVIFPILLHETAKAALELLFANYLKSLTKKYGKNVASEIIKKSDVFEDEIWMKRIGPSLWKHLHDAIDYVIKHDRDDDYTLVSYLLNHLSFMNPDEFIEFMETVVYDGEKTIKEINKMLDIIEYKIEKKKQQTSETPNPKEIENGTQLSTKGIEDVISDLNNAAKEKEEEKSNNKKIDYSKLSKEELQTMLDKAIEEERYEDASEISDTIENID